MNKAFAALALWLGAALPLQAGPQAISTSLTECSVIFREAGDLRAQKGKPQEDVDALYRASGNFLKAAVARAEDEGREDPLAWIAGESHRLEVKWQGRFSSISAFKENMEWIAYCRSIAQDRGISMK